MQTLHQVLADLKRSKPIRVYSALTGAIVVLLDQDQEVFHQLLAPLSDELSAYGLPIRIGVAHGELEALTDADDHLNLIGSVVNTAARLAYADENMGCLYHKSYADSVRGFLGGEADVLAPARGSEIEATGKEHDPRIPCWTAPAFRTLDSPDTDKLLPLPSDVPHARGVILAYDLPRFSRGDRAELSTRFRSVIDALRQIKAEQRLLENKPITFSPGGDGGILLLPVEKGLGYRIATDLVKLLRIESDNKRAGADVYSRVGLHYGQVSLYENAEGVLRPTGPECLIADALATGSVPGSGVVISEQFRDVVTGGNSSIFTQEFTELPTPESGLAAGIVRYAKRSTIDEPEEAEGQVSATVQTPAAVTHSVGVESTIMPPGGGVMSLAANEPQEVQVRVQLSPGSSTLNRLKVKIRIRVHPPSEMHFDKTKFIHQGPDEVTYISTEPDMVQLTVPGLPEGSYLLVAKVTNEDEAFSGGFDPDQCWTCKANSRFIMPFLRG